MKTTSHFRKAFSLVGWMFILGILAFLFVLLLPGGGRCGGSRTAAPRVACLNNLRQIGLGFQMFGEDHGGRFPMALSSAQGGSMEFNTAATTHRHFQCISNYLVNAKVFACPADEQVVVTNIWFLKNENLSFFLGLKATATNRTLLLAGDRNLSTNKVPLKTGIHHLGTNSNAGWTKEIHKKTGNVLLADGSARKVSSEQLLAQIRAASGTNRISLP